LLEGPDALAKVSVIMLITLKLDRNY